MVVPASIYCLSIPISPINRHQKISQNRTLDLEQLLFNFYDVILHHVLL